MLIVKGRNQIEKTTAKARTLAVVFYLSGNYLIIYVISLRPIYHHSYYFSTTGNI